MQHKKGNRKSHALRNTLLIFLLLLIFGGAAYGMSKYRSVKDSVNSSFKPSGLTKERNVSKQLSSKKPISILLMGTDTGALGRDYKGRTDSMMVVTINPETNKTTMTSIPRDTAVNIPGYKDDSPAKINAAYSFGQAETSIKTVQKLLNIPIDFYALINMGGMEKVVNEIGGVDITPTLTFTYEGNTYTKGKKEHMNGKKALGYSRMRYDDPDGDYGRQTRQRAVLMAIIHKSGSISTLLNQKFIDSIAGQTQTDLTFDNLREIATNYRKATKNVSQNHLQGTGKSVSDQSMEVMSKKELQRITNIIRGGLGLKHAKTGNIAYRPSSSSTSTGSGYGTSSSSYGTGSTSRSTSSTGTGTSSYGSGTGSSTTGTGTGTGSTSDSDSSTVTERYSGNY
ncbi:LCP family protein [Companilactobacillus allii]|uniref:LytR family transcriptional regulator n=1 Tax=Companilactobacillus allii TaxID=1847728 RepID=A0A1P8Q2A7_9LACO|nr:LCP family protein [Companilactobacillus allii]APX71966.1 LytR family transcriptional regulator [Companilactobacillus allii]USQ69062.1 LCP family protein [Companilactobacillus allii]